MKLWLVRHAATAAAAGTCYGRLDLASLPDATRAAADALATSLPQDIPVACSPRARCRALAEAVARVRPDLRIDVDPRLAEMDFGRWEGQAWDAIGPQALAAWTGDFLHHAPGGGETVSAFLARVQSAWDETLIRQTDAAWITHAGVMRAAQILHAGRPVRNANDWPADPIAYGSWQVMELPR